jgi:hypothetical protein
VGERVVPSGLHRDQAASGASEEEMKNVVTIRVFLELSTKDGMQKTGVRSHNLEVNGLEGIHADSVAWSAVEGAVKALKHQTRSTKCALCGRAD